MFLLPKVAVVGHVNCGKTAVLQTLACQEDHTAIHDLPGTTAEVREVRSKSGLLVWVDTPGFHDPCGVWSEVEREVFEREASSGHWKTVLGRSDLQRDFRLDIQTLSAIVDCAAFVYVVDATEPPAPKHECQLRMLQATGVPGLVVINRGQSCPPAWRNSLSHFAHNVVLCDAHWPPYAGEVLVLSGLHLRLGYQGAFGAGLDVQKLSQRYKAEEASRWSQAAWLILRVAAVRMTATKEDEDTLRLADLVQKFKSMVIKAVHSELSAIAVQRGLFRPLEWESSDDSTSSVGTGLLGAKGLERALLLNIQDQQEGIVCGHGSVLEKAITRQSPLTLGFSFRSITNRVHSRQDLYFSNDLLRSLVGQVISAVSLISERGHGSSQPMIVRTLARDRIIRITGLLEPVLNQARRRGGEAGWQISIGKDALSAAGTDKANEPKGKAALVAECCSILNSEFDRSD